MNIDTSGIEKGIANLMDDYNNSTQYVEKIELNSIMSDPFQPRKDFVEEQLLELANDIQENGLLQPILVRPGSNYGQYIIIAGERRYRAAKLLEMETIDCIVRDDLKNSAQNAIAKIQVAENLKRDDLKFWEIAEYIDKRLNDKHDVISKEDLAKELGISSAKLSHYQAWEKAPDFLKSRALMGDIKSLTAFYEISLKVDNEEDLDQILANTNSVSQIRRWKRHDEEEIIDGNNDSSNNLDEIDDSISDSVNEDVDFNSTENNSETHEIKDNYDIDEDDAEDKNDDKNADVKPKLLEYYFYNNKKCQVLSGTFTIMLPDGSTEQISK